MKKRDLSRLNPADRLAVEQLIKDQPGAVLVRSGAQNKGFSDLPLFAVEKQTKLF